MSQAERNTASQRQRSRNLGALRGLLPFLRPYRLRIALALLALLIAASATLTMPAAIRQVGARIAAPVEKADQQMAVREPGIQRREQAPRGITIERWRLVDRRFDVLELAFELRAIRGAIQVGRHVVERALQLDEIRAQLFARERERGGIRLRNAAGAEDAGDE